MGRHRTKARLQFTLHYITLHHIILYCALLDSAHHQISGRSSSSYSAELAKTREMRNAHASDSARSLTKPCPSPTLLASVTAPLCIRLVDLIHFLFLFRIIPGYSRCDTIYVQDGGVPQGILGKLSHYPRRPSLRATSSLHRAIRLLVEQLCLPQRSSLTFRLTLKCCCNSTNQYVHGQPPPKYRSSPVSFGPHVCPKDSKSTANTPSSQTQLRLYGTPNATSIF